MEHLIPHLRERIEGTITTAPSTRALYRTDGSVFEITPDAVATPATINDLKEIVRFVSAHKTTHPSLGITPRGAGTDMTGASIGSSVVVDMTKLSSIHHFNGTTMQAQAGVRVADIENVLHAHGRALGSSPSSRDVATLGGMVGNNAGGDWSYRYGSTQRWVQSLNVILADGNEYTIRPLTKPELDRKMAEQSYEGRLYSHIYSILDKHYDSIRNARPYTKRNASGYNIWDVWDKESGVFDLTQLFTGSQGTLGIITAVTLGTVKKPAFTGSVTVAVPRLKKLSAAIETLRKYEPLSIEGFDDITLIQSLKSRKTLRKRLGALEYSKQLASRLPVPVKQRKDTVSHIITATFSADTAEELINTIERVQQEMSRQKLETDSIIDAEWVGTPVKKAQLSTRLFIQDLIQTYHAASFIDDMAVNVRHVDSFLSRLRKLLKKHGIEAVIHGHYGDGIFHIVPLEKSKTSYETGKIEALMRDITSLVIEFDGTLSGEHGDGMLRGPWLRAQFGHEIYTILKSIKEIFDPLYIFNPHKKTDASWEYSMSHLQSKK